MKNILILFLVLLFVGCKTQQYIPVETKTVIQERLVPVEVPADSSSYFALLECDSLNRVFIKQLSESKTSNVTESFKLKNNQLSVNFKSQPADVKVVVRDSIVTQQIPYPVKGDTQIVFEQHWWQETFMWIGIAFLILIIILIIIRIWKSKI